ncbi:MAG: SCO6745 family protein [Mycobacteriales bacterium]
MTDTALATLARKAHQTVEPTHAFIYFAPQAHERYLALGLKGGRMPYFAARSAAFGEASADLVIASFYNFAPSAVRRAIPDAWRLATPQDVLAARYLAVDDVLRPLIGPTISAADLAEAAALAREAAGTLEPAGRCLFAAHAALPWPDGGEPHLVLWHALTLLREWRGDAHVALLLGEGIGGCEALILHALCGGPEAAVLQATRGWSDAEWSAARDRLTIGGLLNDGSATPAAVALRGHVEQRTDELAVAPWAALGAERTERLRTLVRPVSVALAPMRAPMANRAAAQDPGR